MALLFVGLAGCSLTSHSISGAYIAQSPQFVELLQLTQSADGQLLGSLQHYEIKADGTPVQKTMSVSGSTDGSALTLIFKLSEPLSTPANFSGTVDGGAITLTEYTTNERYVASSADAYQTAVAQLSAKGQAIQQNIALTKRTNDNNDTAIALTNELNSYSAMIESRSDRLSTVRKDQADMVDAARKDLDIEARLKAGSSYQQGQGYVVGARIGQLHANLVQMNLTVLAGINSGRQRIKDFDARLASSSCKIYVNSGNVSACADLTAAEKRYLTVRANVLKELDEAQASVDESSASMVAINKQAGNE